MLQFFFFFFTNITHSIVVHILFSDYTFTATGNEVFVVSSKAGVDCVEALGHTLVLPHQHPVLKVPQVHSLQTSPLRLKCAAFISPK